MTRTLHLSTVGVFLGTLAASCSSEAPGPGAGAMDAGAGGSRSDVSVSGDDGGSGSGSGSGGSGSSSGGGSSDGGAGTADTSGGAIDEGGPSAGGGAGGGRDSGENAADGEAGAVAGCAAKTYKLCDDFESGPVGGIPNGWTALKGWAPQRGGVGLANDQFHSGSMSLKSDSMNTGQDRVQRSLAALGATATKHWGRIFYRVQSPPPTPNSGVIHITFTALEGTTEDRVVDTVVATNGSHQWLYNIPDDSCCAGSDYGWTFDTAWHCAEWNIDVAAESFRFYSDGKEVPQLAFTGRAGAKMSNYMSIALGTIFYQTPPRSVVVWFDDLAIDDNQIGCR